MIEKHLWNFIISNETKLPWMVQYCDISENNFECRTVSRAVLLGGSTSSYYKDESYFYVVSTLLLDIYQLV